MWSFFGILWCCAGLLGVPGVSIPVHAWCTSGECQMVAWPIWRDPNMNRPKGCKGTTGKKKTATAVPREDLDEGDLGGEISWSAPDARSSKKREGWGEGFFFFFFFLGPSNNTHFACLQVVVFFCDHQTIHSLEVNRKSVLSEVPRTWKSLDCLFPSGFLGGFRACLVPGSVATSPVCGWQETISEGACLGKVLPSVSQYSIPQCDCSRPWPQLRYVDWWNHIATREVDSRITVKTRPPVLFHDFWEEPRQCEFAFIAWEQASSGMTKDAVFVVVIT